MSFVPEDLIVACCYAAIVMLMANHQWWTTISINEFDIKIETHDDHLFMTQTLCIVFGFVASITLHYLPITVCIVIGGLYWNLKTSRDLWRMRNAYLRDHSLTYMVTKYGADRDQLIALLKLCATPSHPWTRMRFPVIPFENLLELTPDQRAADRISDPVILENAMKQLASLLVIHQAYEICTDYAAALRSAAFIDADLRVIHHTGTRLVPKTSLHPEILTALYVHAAHSVDSIKSASSGERECK